MSALRRWFLCVASAWIVLAPASSYAQARLTGADLAGIVRAPDGSRVRGCAITVTNLETNLARTSVSDGTGLYTVPALPPGSYSVAAAMPGFKAQTHERIELQLGQNVTVDFSLQLATATEVVTVTASTQDVSARRTEIGTVISQQQIDSLPTNGRNFIAFAALTPGVARDRTPLQGAASTSGLSFTGQRARSNNLMVDGLDNNDPVMGAVRATFSQEAVREFQVLVNSYTAEFGKASAGIVNIVTKSGTNALRGNAFLFLRDKALNARGYFERFDVSGRPVAQDKAPFHQTQWGATLGGPLRKDRTFYFASFEDTAIEDSRFVSIDPSAADALNRLGFPVALGNVPFKVANTEILGKLDHQWIPGRSFTLRGSYANIDREALDDFGGIVARSRATVQLRKDWSVSAAETDVLSARWIHELRGQFAYENQHVNPLDPVCGGACEGVDQGGPTVEVTGVASAGRHRFTPLLRLNKRVQIADTVSYLKGAHHVKFGVDYGDVFFPSDGNLLPSHFGGRFIFTAFPPLGVTSGLDGLVKGIPVAYIQGFGNPYFPDERIRDLSLFAQDEWQRGRVVIRSGIRYQQQFWQDRTFTVSDVGGGTFIYQMPRDRNNLAPRLGLSYDVTGTARTIAHGSYGVFYDNVIIIAESPGRVSTGTADGTRTLVLPAPLASVAWNAPGHRLTEADAVALLGGSYVSVVAAPSASLENSFTHQASAGVDHSFAADLSLSVNFIYARGFNFPGTLDYNPTVPALGPGRRPNDAACATNPAAVCVNGGIPGTSTSVIQFASFGESWYRGLTVAVNKRLSRNYQFLFSYTLSKAEDTSTDFQSAFIPQNNGLGRNPADRAGLPLGFDPRLERGPATHDQRHRIVASGMYQLPGSVQVSGILTAGSGRPFTPLAGADLNGDGNGGQFPPDRARRNLADESTSIGRNSATTVGHVTVDVRASRRFRLGPHATIEAIVEAFNLFNRVNFVEDTNQSSFVIFGSGAYPSNPLPGYGRYTLAMPPRQVQLAAKISF